MTTVHVTIDDQVLEAGLQRAAREGKTLDALIEEALRHVVQTKSRGWLQQSFQLADQSGAVPRDWKWSRQDTYLRD